MNPGSNGERGGGCHSTTRVGKRPQPGEGCTLDILPLRQAPPSPAPHGSVCLLLDLGDRVKLHPEDVCAIGRARVGMSGGMEGGACAARGRVRHARTCSPYNPYPRPHRSRGRQSTSVPTVSLQGDGEVSKRRIGAVDASTQVAASAAWDRAKDAASAGSARVRNRIIAARPPASVPYASFSTVFSMHLSQVSATCRAARNACRQRGHARRRRGPGVLERASAYLEFGPRVRGVGHCVR